MTNREITALGLKIAGLYAITVAIIQLQPTLSFLVAALDAGYGWARTTMEFVPVLGLGLLAGLLIWQSNQLAGALANDAEVTEGDKARSRNLHAVALSCFGVWFIGGALVGFSEPFARFVARLLVGRPEDGGPWAGGSGSSHVISNCVKLGFGLWLFLGSEATVRLFRRLRRPPELAREAPTDGDDASDREA